VLDPAVELDAPPLHVSGRKPQAAERNADLHLVAPSGDPAPRLPLEVRAQVVLPRRHVGARNEATPLALGAVGLNPEWIHDEHEGPSALLEGIEVDLDMVVADDPVAFSQRGANGAMELVRTDPDEQRNGGVPDQHVRRVRRRPLVGRLVQREPGEQCR